MAEETNSVRITNAQVYEKLLEVSAIQIEMVTELRGLRDVPKRINAVEVKLARFEWIERVAYLGLGSGISALVMAVLK